MHTHHVSKTGAGLSQGLLDVFKALLGLYFDVIRNSHVRVVEASRALDEDPVSVHHGSRVCDFVFEARTGADEDALHGACGNVCLCGLTFELSGHRRRGVLDSKRKMG